MDELNLAKAWEVRPLLTRDVAAFVARLVGALN